MLMNSSLGGGIMFLLKNLVFLFTVIVSFLFPSEQTLFLSLIAANASIFCDYFEIVSKLEVNNRAAKSAGARLYGIPFFSMLVCSILSGNVSFGFSEANGNKEFMIYFFRGYMNFDYLFCLDYVLFSICTLSILVLNIYSLTKLYNKFSNSNIQPSFQDLIES